MIYCTECGSRYISGDATYYPNEPEGSQFSECGDDWYCDDCGETDVTEDRHAAAVARLEHRRWRAKIESCGRCHGEKRIPLHVGPGVPGAGAFARFEPCPECAA